MKKTHNIHRYKSGNRFTVSVCPVNQPYNVIESARHQTYSGNLKCAQRLLKQFKGGVLMPFGVKPAKRK